MKNFACYCLASIAFTGYTPSRAAELHPASLSEADTMLECAAFYDAAAAAVRQRPELSNTQFLVGNPGRASLLLFSSGTQIYGVQAGWNKYAAMQRDMMSQLQSNAADFARLVTRYDTQCRDVVERAGKTRA